MKRITSILLTLAMSLMIAPMSISAQDTDVPAVDLENPYLGEVFVAVNGDPSNGEIGSGETFTVNKAPLNAVQGDIELFSEDLYSEGMTLEEEIGAKDVEMYFMTEEEMEEAIFLASNSAPSSYAVGDSMTRTISDETMPGQTRSATFECVTVGTHCTVWKEVRTTPVVGLSELTTEAANEIANEFDNKYASFCNFVGDVDYIDSDNDGKIAILCYDIDSNFENTTGDNFNGGYTLGYFWGADLTGSNGTALDCIHIDTFPVMAQNYNKKHQLQRVSACFSTLFHEFQHYAWKSNRGLSNSSVRANESFYNEGLSMAVQHALYGYQNTAGRISTFNKVQRLNPGRALKWYDIGSDDYGHAYLFSQYLRTRYSQMVNDGADGATIFKVLYQKIADGQNNNDLLGTYADILYPTSTYPSLTTTKDRIAKLVLDFWIATYVKADTGAYGFAGEDFADSINVVPSIQSSVPATSSNIYNGGAVFYYSNNKLSGSVDVNEAASGANMEFAAINSESKTRDIVLLLDYSGSMNSSQIVSLKTAAKSFCEQTCDGTNTRVSIIKYSTSPSVVCGLTADKNELISKINNLSNYSENMTHMAEALDKSDDVLSSSTADKQVIILMTDGVPNGREENTSNRYPGYDSYSAVYDTADNMIKKYDQNNKNLDIYTLGFYSYSYSDSLAEVLLTDIANIVSNEGTYVKVTDANDLIFTFSEFGSGQNNTGEKIRVEIACPVEVRLSVNCENIVETDEDGNLVITSGVEYLDSTDPTHTASFGTIEVTGSGSNTHVVLNVDRYNDYQLQVTGTDSGSCDINVVGTDGTRKFENIPLQNGTTITGNMNLYDAETNNTGILLDVDSNGDGQTDNSITSVDNLRDTYTINYYVDGTLYQNKSCRVGKTIVPIEAPAKAGYTFVRWDDLPDTMPNKNIDVHAVYTNTVLEKVSAPTASIASGAVTSGTQIALSTTTADANIYYTTDGSEPTTGANLYSTPITITSATTIKAIAVKAGMLDSDITELTYNIRSSGGGGGGGTSSYTVKFETNGGSKVSNKSVKRNSTITEPTVPIKDGYTFEGWFSDKELTKEFDFTTKITKSTTLYAKWKEIPKTVITLTIGEKTAVINEKTVENDVAPKIVNDRTMLPIRFIAEALSANVEWFGETQTVKISAEGIDISLVIGETFATVNGEKTGLDSPSFVENDRTYLPIRFVSEKLGADVKWDEGTQTVTITK